MEANQITALTLLLLAALRGVNGATGKSSIQGKISLFIQALLQSAELFKKTDHTPPGAAWALVDTL